MEKHLVKEDIKVICQPVASFPLGIKEAFDTLMERFGAAGRTYYGISYMDENDRIVYKAAVSQLSEGEGLEHGYESFLIRKGNYLSQFLAGWMSQTGKIKDIFYQLMKEPGVDNDYPCIEWYKNDEELLCMMRMKEQ